MEETIKISAVHPHWTGMLILFPEKKRVRLEPFGSLGNYILDNRDLIIIWDKFPKEEFIIFDNICVQKNHIGSIIDLNKLKYTKLDSEVFAVSEIAFDCPIVKSKIYIRPSGSDVPTYRQIFFRGEYNFNCFPENPKIIVDVGANIGLASLYFSKRYSGADILAVEPEVENFRLLSLNTEPRVPKMMLERASIWHKDGTVRLRTHDDSGKFLDSWGIQVTDSRFSQTPEIPSLTLGTLFHKYGLDRVDILKIDVEGAELEIFSAVDQSWKSMVDYIIIETHDRFRPGCEAAVRSALEQSFVQIAGEAELLVFGRRGVLPRV